VLKWYKVSLFFSFADKKPLEVEESVQKISKVAEDEKGKPYRIGFFYEMSETNHRGHYTCQVRKNGESNVDVGSSGTGSVLAECTYYVRVKGNSSLYRFSLLFISLGRNGTRI